VSVLGVLLAAASTLLIVAVGDLVSEEVRSRLDRLPHVLLRLAAWRLPAELREDRLAEWTGELHQFLRGTEALPVTRLVRGIRYAAGLLQVAPTVGGRLMPSAQAIRRLVFTRPGVIVWWWIRRVLRGRSASEAFLDAYLVFDARVAFSGQLTATLIPSMVTTGVDAPTPIVITGRPGVARLGALTDPRRQHSGNGPDGSAVSPGQPPP
jgi:hypothetical protein